VDRLFPARVPDVDDEQLLSWYAMPERPEGWVRFNFVASADGAATVQGRSGGLGNAADFRVLHLLRRLADVLLVGAGTIRAEGYGGDLVGDDGRSWRLERGLSPHPPVAVVSGRLDLDPGAPLFTEAVARPIVVTTAQADAERRRALARVADVVDAGEASVDPVTAMRALAERGLVRVLSEGGPTLLGSFQQADALDDLCLSLSPVLVGGTAPRIAVGAGEHLRRLQLAHVLEGEGLLLLRYVATPSGD
jgi:riboflavin biosynthesis pyrimidine reductase